MSDWERVREKIEFASTARLDFHAELLDDFICRVLRMDPAWTVVTDASSLDEFPEAMDVYVERIQEVYWVDITRLPNNLIPTVLEVVAAHLAPWRRADLRATEGSSQRLR